MVQHPHIARPDRRRDVKTSPPGATSSAGKADERSPPSQKRKGRYKVNPWHALRKLARDALDVGPDVTAYMLSYTARSFVPYYAQRISHAIVMHGAAGVHKGITRMQCARLRRASAA